MNGLELAIRFSYITNSLRFCGPHEASTEFINYLKNKRDDNKVADLIKRFEGLYPYLNSIAEKNNKSDFDFNVVEAYWIGNELLMNFNKEDIKNIITKLMQRGLSVSLGERLILNLPLGFYPHHNFNVMYVGVGNVTGSVETNLQNMDNCRISWGKVLEVSHEKLLVETNSLKYNKKKYYIGDDEVKTIIYIDQMLPDIKKNDMVALHWGFAPLILSKKQLLNLKKFTNHTIKIING